MDRLDRASLVELPRLLLPPALLPVGCTEAAAHCRVHNDAFRVEVAEQLDVAQPAGTDRQSSRDSSSASSS